MHVVLGTLGQTAGADRQNAAGPYRYGIVPIAVSIIYKYVFFSLHSSHSLKVAVVLEEAQQMLAQGLCVVRLVRLDGLYQIEIEAFLLPQIELIGVQRLQAGQHVRHTAILQIMQHHQHQRVARHGHPLGIVYIVILRPQLHDDHKRPGAPVHCRNEGEQTTVLRLKDTLYLSIDNKH